MNAFLDLGERIFWAFAAAFVGSLVASPVFDDLGIGWQEALQIALASAVLRALVVFLAYAQNKDSGGAVIPSVEVKPDPPA
jgi:uncharacterized membrane protein YeaQ/YmgE (transglycosylase-associated protein family)